MSERQEIVALGRRAWARGEQLCLATVVHVEGSSYRKPGARMLMTSGGERAGTISGGCLEAEVSRKAWWLTSDGPRVERYSSFADEDGGMPYGLGCGGVVTLLLEQGEAVRGVLEALDRALTQGWAGVVIHAPGGDGVTAGTAGVLVSPGPQAACEPGGAHRLAREPGRLAGEHRARTGKTLEVLYEHPGLPAAMVRESAHSAWEQQRSLFVARDGDEWREVRNGAWPAWFIEYVAAPPALTVFGAGDDAQPIAELASTLGWRVTVADGRAHLARRERFPRAAAVRVLDYADPSLRAACGVAASADWHPPEPGACDGLVSDEVAVILTHSYEQDRALLAALLPRPMRYLGILGPRHRTERLLAEVTPVLGMTLEEGFARLHSPVGLDLGAGEPAAVALSIVAEIQAVLHERRVTVTRNTVEAIAEPFAVAIPDA